MLNVNRSTQVLLTHRMSENVATNTEIFNIVRFHYSLGELN